MLNFGAFGATKACFLKCRADGQNAFPCVLLDALPNFPLALLKNKRRISSFPLLLPSLMLTRAGSVSEFSVFGSVRFSSFGYGSVRFANRKLLSVFG